MESMPITARHPGGIRLNKRYRSAQRNIRVPSVRSTISQSSVNRLPQGDSKILQPSVTQGQLQKINRDGLRFLRDEFVYDKK